MQKQLIGLIPLVAIVGHVVAEDDKVAAYFKSVDADGDGKLNQAESAEMTRTQLEKKGRTDYEAEAAKRFRHHDANADGFITLEEHKAIVEMLKKKKEAEAAAATAAGAKVDE